MELILKEFYKLTEDIERLPKMTDPYKYCGGKGQIVQLLRLDCGFCIVCNESSQMKYWVKECQLSHL